MNDFQFCRAQVMWHVKNMIIVARTLPHYRLALIPLMKFIWKYFRLFDVCTICVSSKQKLTTFVRSGFEIGQGDGCTKG